MTPEVKEALLASIAHWEENLAAGIFGARIYGQSCPLCNMTRSSPEGLVNCDKCPIQQKTGEWECGETPWHDVAAAFNDKNETFFTSAARREIAFLRSLLPPEAPEAPDAQ